MSALYFETSACLAWLLEEPDFERISGPVDRAKEVVASVLTIVEIKRALLRMESSGKLKSRSRQKALGLFEQASSAWKLVEITPEIQSRAGQSFPVEPVRTLDAIHLASMLEILKIFPDLTVVSLDRRIRSNLEPLGIPAAKI